MGIIMKALAALALAAAALVTGAGAAVADEPTPKVHRTWSGTPYPESRQDIPRTWSGTPYTPKTRSTVTVKATTTTRTWHGTPWVAPERSWSGGSVFYVIQSGDTLWSIAVRFCGDGHQWPAIAEHNGIEGTLIFAGDFLRVNCS